MTSINRPLYLDFTNFYLISSSILESYPGNHITLLLFLSALLGSDSFLASLSISLSSLCVYECTCTCRDTRVDVRGQA